MENLPSIKQVLEIEICNRQSHVAVDAQLLQATVRQVLLEAAVQQASISVAIVDDATIAQINERYLAHQGPTDVLSFSLDDDETHAKIEGEIITSAETALKTAPLHGWTAADELLLYVTHGALHLVGYDDHTIEDRAAMRAAEKRLLQVYAAGDDRT